MYLTHKSFLDAVEKSGSDYWKEGASYRWKYMEYVIEQLKKMDAKIICEAGASGIPLNSESFLFDYPLFDLDKFPYRFNGITVKPLIQDKHFDCFVALQVWEHLDKQQKAFKEVMRISKNAILSFPYKWGKGHDKRHQGIDGAKIEEWTCGIKPASTIIIQQRAIYVWQF
jgi:hypothetical protein